MFSASLRPSQLIARLDIQPKKQRPSALWTLADNGNDKPAYANPGASPKPPGELQHYRSVEPRVPTVRTTLSSEDFRKQPYIPSTIPVPSPSDGRVAHPPIVRPLRQDPKTKQSALEPRKFHLSKSSLLVSSPYLVSKTPIQKHRKARDRELAVFVEKTNRVLENEPTSKDWEVGVESVANVVAGEERNIIKSSTTRKRPNVSTAERQWRAENWDKPRAPARSTELGTKVAKDVKHPSYQWDYESPELAKQLQEIASQEIKAQEKRSNNSASPPHLKTKPKPPQPRQPAVQHEFDGPDEHDGMAGVVAHKDDDDYIFDTYVRSQAYLAGMTDSAEPLTNSLHGLDLLNMGLLVIEEGEDEILWEAFGEDLDSDPDWNSEEEDENGMGTLLG